MLYSVSLSLLKMPPPELTIPTERAPWKAEPAVTPEEITTPAPAVEEIPSAIEVEVTPPLAVETPVPVGSLAAARDHLEKHPRDHKIRLTLAQALWQADEYQESMEAYTQLIRAGQFLDNVIPELENYVRQRPTVDVQTALGDAYMKDGRLQEALDIYRRTLVAL